MARCDGTTRAIILPARSPRCWRDHAYGVAPPALLTTIRYDVSSRDGQGETTEQSGCLPPHSIGVLGTTRSRVVSMREDLVLEI